ncbi:MAG: translation initiation factor IF-2 subunit beta [Halobacteriaceae archaeon]
MDYDEQLNRALDETPDIEGESERFEVPDPDLRSEGNVTVYENYRETVNRLDRDPGHLLKFLQDELGTSAHIDERGRARLTGSFRESRMADVIETYLDKFVRCPECGLPDTSLVTEQGATLIKCDACGARSTTGA